MIRSSRDLLRNNTFAGVAVVLWVAVALSVTAVYYLKALSQLGNTASNNSSLTYDDREIAGGNSVIVDQAAAYEARSLIPRRAAYRFAIGSLLQERTELTEKFAGDWFRYFLMPRRPRLDARWVICYGCDISALGSSYAVRWHDEKGISIGRLR
jgi:hypothetical protein